MQGKININPLSVNKCWQGRRFKTQEYKIYEQSVLIQLRAQKAPQKPFILHLEFGVSTTLLDIDNPVKPFVDILQKKYGINDRDIVEMHVKKTIVKRGNEFVKFELCSNI